MVELWMVRHGETDWNTIGRIQGWTDIPLNANGLAQAEELALKLQGKPFAAVISSDLVRARVTAETLARGTGLTVEVDERLRERCHGTLEGYFYADFQRDHPGLVAAMRADPVNTPMPGGESLADAAARMIAAADDIAARFPGQRVLLVTHGLVLAILYCLASAIPLAEARHHIPANAVPIVIHWGAAG